jgi:phage-related baseplate assembly protein
MLVLGVGRAVPQSRRAVLARQANWSAAAARSRIVISVLDARDDNELYPQSRGNNKASSLSMKAPTLGADLEW